VRGRRNERMISFDESDFDSVAAQVAFSPPRSITSPRSPSPRGPLPSPRPPTAAFRRLDCYVPSEPTAQASAKHSAYNNSTRPNGRIPRVASLRRSASPVERNSPHDSGAAKRSSSPRPSKTLLLATSPSIDESGVGSYIPITARPPWTTLGQRSDSVVNPPRISRPGDGSRALAAAEASAAAVALVQRQEKEKLKNESSSWVNAIGAVASAPFVASPRIQAALLDAASSASSARARRTSRRKPALDQSPPLGFSAAPEEAIFAESAASATARLTSPPRIARAAPSGEIAMALNCARQVIVKAPCLLN
jgi:hypothetical protein